MVDWGRRFDADKAEGTVLVLFVPSVDRREEPIDRDQAPRRKELTMASRIEDLAAKLGAEVVSTFPDYSAGAFGVAGLARTLRERLEPSRGKRPGRPTNPRWSKRSKVPLAEETEKRLEHLAHLLSDEHRKVSPMQVAAHLLEEAAASYFPRAEQRRGRGRSRR